MTNNDCRFSVIMTVYDNARELQEYLPAFLSQEYEPGYEVIVVDESSTDDTEDVLKLQKQDHPQLYTTFLPKPDRHVIRKKMALTIGVKAAKNEWVIMSDIHAAPLSALWLQELSEAIDETTEVMLGYFQKGGTKLQAFGTVEEASALIRKAERKKADGHKGSHLKYLRGKYDFIVVRKEKAHDVLKYYEEQIGKRHLIGLRLSVMCHNLH